MSDFLGYRCSLCNREYLPGQVTYTCPQDGGNLDVVLDYAKIKGDDLTQQNEPGLWRFLPLLPVADPGGIGTPLRVAGGTPIYSLSLLAEDLGLSHLWLKDESRNPSASFKDRASAIVVARAREIGAEKIVTASTGNAGAALACMAASIGQKAIIFAPRNAPPAKVAQLLVFGAQVILVEGNYDDAFDLTIQATQEFGWYCRNTGYNPFTIEGKKTAAFEIWEWWQNQPVSASGKSLNIFVSVGDGNIISGIYKGYKDLRALGMIANMPRMFGVQAVGSSAVADAFHRGTESVQPVHSQTIADSISVDLPRDGTRAVRAARDTNGSYLTVRDEEILRAIASLGSVGVFAEPAGAASFAGMVKALQAGLLQPDDPVLVINTGSGLKDVNAAMRAVHQATIIEPSLDALKRMIK